MLPVYFNSQNLHLVQDIILVELLLELSLKLIPHANGAQTSLSTSPTFLLHHSMKFFDRYNNTMVLILGSSSLIFPCLN